MAMSAPAYKINERRSSYGYTGGGNWLIESAIQKPDRKRIAPQDRDFHRNISTFGRRTLLTLGRWMFWNIPQVMGMVLEQADLAVGTFIPQFYGDNKDWGNKGENWLTEWHKIFDIAGPPFDYEFYLQNLIMAPLVDGDFGTLLTDNGAGYPMIQIIPGHRIGGRTLNTDLISGGEYDGAQIVDGVIRNDYNRALAYRVYGEDYDAENYQDISARDMFLTFTPLFPGQLRGISGLASSAFNWQDSQEWDRFEMLAQKLFASQTIVETNESGSTDPAKDLMRKPATFDSDNNKTTLDEQSFSGGTVRYFKAGTGSKLEPFHYDRPATSTQEFQSRKIRDAFRGTQWDAFFSLDPQAVGGAPMRVIVDKINRTLKKRRRAAGKACVRVDGYGIAKAIKNGDLPEDIDWWKFEHQGPGDVTADRKYDSDVDIQEIHARIGTRKSACGRRGEYYEDVDAQTELEADSDIAAAVRLSKKHGITFEQAITVLRPPTPNGMQAQQQANDNPKNADKTGGNQ